MRPSILVTLLVYFLFSCNANEPEGSFSKQDIKSAQKLIGLDFNDQELDTLYNYLKRNKRGFDSMRASTQPGVDIFPALTFDPKPSGYARKELSSQVNYPKIEQLERPESNSEIAFLSVYEQAYLIKNGLITSTELTNIYLERIEKYDDTLEAVITVTRERALKQAARADEDIQNGKYKGLLHGIPYGVKDLVSVEGYPTTWGAEPYKDQVIDHTATLVKRLDSAGAVLVAKLTSGALARGDVWFGGKTKNPWDLKQGASGSSAGSGAATAAGLVSFSIGTETLGSIISPSTRCGDTGLRPTYGTVSRDGVMSLSWSMDKVGPICRTALDCALVYEVISGKDPLDQTSYQVDFGFDPPQNLSGLKIGYFNHLFEDDSSARYENNMKSLEVFRSLGADLEEVSLPEDLPYAVFDIILRSEAGAFFDELVREHDDRTMVQQNVSSRANSLRQSRFIPAVEYLQANRYRKILIEQFYETTKEFDVIISPTAGFRQLLITNLTGNPAMSLPDGFDEDGHPTSITIIGNLFEDQKLLEIGWMFQEHTNHESLHPEMFNQ